MNGETNDAVDLNEDKSIDTEEEVKVVGKSFRNFSFCERMKILSLHRYPLKDRMEDKNVFYADLLRLGLPPSRTNDEIKPQASKRLANRK